MDFDHLNGQSGKVEVLPSAIGAAALIPRSRIGVLKVRRFNVRRCCESGKRMGLLLWKES